MTTYVMRRAIGELCVGGDWACTTGDLETLGHLAGRLAADAVEPLRDELRMLAAMCRSEPDASVAEWLRLKQRLLEEDGRPASTA